MTVWRWLGIAAIAMAAVGCSMSVFETAEPTGGSGGADAAPGGFTILLCTFEGPDHIRDATESKRKTENVTHWKNLYVIHEAEWSCLYLGRYASQEDAGKDVQKVQRWTSPGAAGGAPPRPFAQAYVQTRAEPRVGPLEWDLANVTDPNWRYTVIIAQFHNVPEEGYVTRKQLAVDNCLDLRKRGKDAYYFHGPEQSFVTIGLFSRQAFYMEQLPDGTARPVIVDEKLGDILKEWSYLAVNGYKCQSTFITMGVPEKRYLTSYVQALSEFRSGTVARPGGGAGYPQPR